VLIGLGIVGVLAGSLHPLGLVLALVEWVAFTGFAAALGIWTSLRTGDTMRAVARVLAGLLIILGGALLIGLPLLAFRPLALVGCPPALLVAALASSGEVWGTRSRAAREDSGTRCSRNSGSVTGARWSWHAWRASWWIRSAQRR
jgi:hypothetical protein